MTSGELKFETYKHTFIDYFQNGLRRALSIAIKN